MDADFGTVELSDDADFAFRTYVTVAAVPVTAERLCRDTHTALQTSPKYARNKKAVDASAKLLCGILAQIGPRMTPQKTKFVKLYKAGLVPLVRSGWLTATVSPRSRRSPIARCAPGDRGHLLFRARIRFAP